MKMILRKILLLSILVLIFAFSSLVYAQVPQMINYQGKITRPNGALIDTTTTMIFSIYSDSTGGTPLWTEAQTVKIEYGVYSVLLGSVTPIPSSVFNGSVRYLGLKVGSDLEMSPRKPMVSVGYAFKALIGDDDWDGAGTGNMFTHFLTDKVGIGTKFPRSQLDVRCPSDTSSFILIEPGIFDGCNGVAIAMNEYRNHNLLTINAYDEFFGNFINTRDSADRCGQGFGIMGGNNVAPFDRFVVNTDSMFLGYAIRPGDGGRIPSNDGGGNLFINGNVGIGTIDTGDYKLYVKGKNKGIYAVATEGATLTTTSGETPFDVGAQPPDERPYAVVADVNTPNSVLTGGGYYTKLYTANTPNVTYLYGANFNVDDNDASGHPHHVRGITSYLLNTGADDYAVEIIANDPSYAIYSDGTGKVYFEGDVGIGTSSPQRALHISDVMRLEPRTSAPSNPSEGDIYVNSTNHHMFCYLNGVWKQLDN